MREQRKMIPGAFQRRCNSLQDLSTEFQIERFDLISGPGSLSQKLQAGLYARIIIKTPDVDHTSHFIPAIIIDQSRKDHLKSYPVKRVVGLLVAHITASLIDR
jgi:hypothetical protein